MIQGSLRFIVRLLAILLLVAPMRAGAADGAAATPIRIGLLPTVATLSLLKLYDPLRQHLQQALGRPVELYTSGNFHSYLDDIAAVEFDMLVAAPHFGVIATDRGYVAMLRYQQELTPLIVVTKESALREARHLRGKRVLTADRLAALSVVAETWMMVDYGMLAGVDYELNEVSSHSTAVRAVAIGDADAAISSASVLQQLPEDQREKVVSFASRLRIPHQFILAHPRLGQETIGVIREALGDFGATEKGRAFFKAGGFKGLVPVTPADMEQARPYAQMVMRAGNSPATNGRSGN
ncbi:Periplasmic binding protein-related protein [Paramagnetospirillum magnetotacticum MS-1]|uniref:Periplasmic binding protein-related protein n=1 Tax=Paramagnetospirillum magnetotacticum MS-1 TaxID=272627 RepID=A0A0C2UGJ7_PARME|nr:phosphate/phosphite/phosphonate ABC transporter substrate-binding protein [Paramagnetospirillum magnetotacticum]KIM00673.1 Periplasmic binding protein-related protein [Paramagnetospirillum magnetotacticum MS-1]